MYRDDRDASLPLMRVLTGIRTFGYTFEAAIFDIMDNSIVAGAKELNVQIEAEEGKATQNLTRIVISDNGSGMNLDEIYNALFLGSPESVLLYGSNSLAKYGFGLKSAGLSLADTVSVISRKSSEDEWKKSRINWQVFEVNNKYIVDEDIDIPEDEQNYTNNLDHGTVIILDDLLNINKINIDAACKHLKKEAGVTFHRFIEEDNLKIIINGKEVEAYDPLFCSEVECEFSKYDGRTPRSYWKKDAVIPINAESRAAATVKAVLLPNPPVFESEGNKSKINKKYGLTKKNIGFYIYRNRRLIKKGVTLGLITRKQETYPIRIRIDLDSSCDSFINLDVKKTELYFSEQFIEKLKNRVAPFVNRSNDLWKDVQKKTAPEEQSSADILHNRSNQLLVNATPVSCDPKTLDVRPTQEEITRKIEEIRQEYKPEPNIIEEIKRKNGDRIIAVDNIENGILWMPDITDNDDENKVIVLLSRSHPFYSKIYNKLTPGSDAVAVLDALFLNMAMAELGISCSDVKKLSQVFKSLRQSVSFQLSNFIDINIDDEEEIEDED